MPSNKILQLVKQRRQLLGCANHTACRTIYTISIQLNLHQKNYMLYIKNLGVQVDNKLLFKSYVNNVVTKDSQRMFIIRNFLYQSTKPLA